MILVDTTVWIDFFRGAPTAERVAFRQLIAEGELLCITDVILTEILRGAAQDKEYEHLKRYLSSFPCLTAHAPRTFIHAADLYRSCRRKGESIRSTVDCLIAAVCIENSVPLLHRDTDFKRLAKFTSLKTVDPQKI
jgi:predicted nucleic acid-binding protein